MQTQAKRCSKSCIVPSCLYDESGRRRTIMRMWIVVGKRWMFLGAIVTILGTSLSVVGAIDSRGPLGYSLEIPGGVCILTALSSLARSVAHRTVTGRTRLPHAPLSPWCPVASCTLLAKRHRREDSSASTDICRSSVRPCTSQRVRPCGGREGGTLGHCQ